MRKSKNMSILDLIEGDNRIKIPMIQRDYAHGRKAHRKIACKFIGDIFKGLSSGRENTIQLDFIYGKSIGNTFIPIDGQQRLTSLYLIYYYLLLNNSRDNSYENLKNFSYETRTTSMDFLDQLSTNFQETRETYLRKDKMKISSVIRNSLWFFKAWEEDPTVKGILNVLDLIESKASDYKDLSPRDLGRVKFNIFEIQKHGSSDDLYIKMNSRGKELTDYENFKAQLVKAIEEVYEEDLARTLSIKLDTDWMNIIFKYLNKMDDSGPRKAKSLEYDRSFMNLINNILITNYIFKQLEEVGKTSELASTEGLSQQYRDLSREKSFYLYESFGILNNRDYLDPLFSILYYLEEDLDLESLEDDYDSFFKKVLSTVDLAYGERLKFSYIVCFILTIKKEGLAIDERLAFNLRVFNNLMNNTIYNRDQEFFRTMFQLEEFIGANYKKSSGQIDFSALINANTAIPRSQIEEEKRKLDLFKDENMRQLIIYSEKNPYLRGQLGIILKYYDERENISDYIYYYKIIELIFTKEDPELLNLFRRALLTIEIDGKRYIESEDPESGGGDYIYRYFLKYRDRDYSFRRYFAYDDSMLKFYIKSLLDRMDFYFKDGSKMEKNIGLDLLGEELDNSKLEEELTRLIEDYRITREDKYYYFIKYRELMDIYSSIYYGEYRIKIEENKDHRPYIMIPKGKEVSSRSSEYYSYVLYIELFRKGLKNINYIDSTGNQSTENMKALKIRLDSLDLYISFLTFQGDDKRYKELEDTYIAYVDREKIEDFRARNYPVGKEIEEFRDENLLKDERSYTIVGSFKTIEEVKAYIEKIL